MARKISPELREQIRRTNEEGRQARAQMQEIIDRIEARRLAEQQRAERRRERIRRLLPFRSVA